MTSFRLPIGSKRVRVVLYRPAAGACYYARWMLGGVRHHLSTGKQSEREARIWAGEQAEALAGEQREALPMSALITQYLAVRSFQACLEQRLRAIAAAVRDPVLSALSRAEASFKFQTYFDGLELAPVTRQNYRVALQGFCKFLMRRGLARWEGNPASLAFIELPAVEERDPAVPSDAAVRRLLELVEGPLRAAVVLCLSGLRPRSVVARLAWEDLDFETKQIRTMEKKRARTLAMSEWCKAELAPLRSTGRIWPWNLHTAFAQLKRVRDAEAGLELATLQGCRRYFTDTMYTKGAAPQDESDLAGHTVGVAAKKYRKHRGKNLHHVADLMDLTPKVAKSGRESGRNGSVEVRELGGLMVGM